MRAYNTESLQKINEAAAAKLKGLTRLSVQMAEHPDQLRRLEKFYKTIHKEMPIFTGDNGIEVPFDQFCLKAISKRGKLIAARHPVSTENLPNKDLHYIVATGSIHEDEAPLWRTVASRILSDRTLELMLDAREIIPPLRAVDSNQSAIDVARAEAAWQDEEEDAEELATRVIIGTQAWQLIEDGRVQSLELIDRVLELTGYAQFREFSPQHENLASRTVQHELIDMSK